MEALNGACAGVEPAPRFPRSQNGAKETQLGKCTKTTCNADLFSCPFHQRDTRRPAITRLFNCHRSLGALEAMLLGKKRQWWHLPTIQTWSLATRSGQKRPSETQLRSRRSFRISALPQCLSAAAGPVREDAKVSRGPPNYFLIPLHGATLASNTHVRMLALADKSKEQFRCHLGALP